MYKSSTCKSIHKKGNKLNYSNKTTRHLKKFHLCRKCRHRRDDDWSDVSLTRTTPVRATKVRRSVKMAYMYIRKLRRCTIFLTYRYPIHEIRKKKKIRSRRTFNGFLWRKKCAKATKINEDRHTFEWRYLPSLPSDFSYVFFFFYFFIFAEIFV